MAVLRLLGVPLGGVLGFVLNILFWALADVLPSQARETFVEGLVLVAYPIARLLSFVTRWPLEAEPAMFLYSVAIMATFVLVGMIGGWVVPRWRW